MSKQIVFAKLPEEIQSKYLNRCFPAEKLEISGVTLDLEKRLATANISVTSDFENSYEGHNDNSYHWSGITAYRAVSQLVIGYLCTDFAKTKQEMGEVMQIRSQMRTRRPITDKNNVLLEVEFSKYHKRGKHLFGELNYKLAEGFFDGSMRFAVNID